MPAVAFDSPLDERRPWLEQLDIDAAIDVPGANSPLYLTDAQDGVAVTTSGMGKAEAATTVTALSHAAGVDLTETTWLSAGIAGGAPERTALGSVFFADAVLDWDRKHRWDPAEISASDHAVERLAYLPEGSLHRIEPTLLAAAYEAARDVELATDDRATHLRSRYPNAPTDGPTVGVGPTVTSDEFWHGTSVARAVERYCSAYGLDPYATTQMEDAATAVALARVDSLDRFLSLRAVANFDRPAPDQDVHDSFEGTPETIQLALENLVRVGSAVVEHLLAPSGN